MKYALRIIPAPQVQVPIDELYLQHDLRDEMRDRLPFIYTNFVSSLDGRIAVRDPDSGRWHIPAALQTAEDQRLYMALAAQADVIICSARHANAMLRDDKLLPFPYLKTQDESDLKQWRLAHGRSESPALAIASTRLQFEGGKLQEKLGCPIYVVTGSGADDTAIEAMRSQGVELKVMGNELMVSGANLKQALKDWDFELIYSVAGPGVMSTLMSQEALDRLYLTRVDLMVGGKEFQTFCSTEVPLQDQGKGFSLQSQYRSLSDGPGQSFLVYDL